MVVQHTAGRVTSFSIFLAVVFAIFCLNGVVAASGENLWKPTDLDRIASRGRRQLDPKKFVTFRLNSASLRRFMDEMPLEFSPAARLKEVIIDVPMPDGSVSKFRIEDSPVLSSELSAGLPGWRSFQGYGVDDPTMTARFDWTKAGFHGFILTANGTVYIDPVQENDTSNYNVYYKHDYGAPADDFQCKVAAMANSVIDADPEIAPAFSYGAAIRSYRLAIATTGEWARSTTTSTDPQTVRTAALAAMTTSVNRLDGIYRREIAVTFQLVNPPITNDATNIIFDDPATDPYDNTDSEAQLTINQTTINNRVGTTNYDLGHLYGTGGGGVAASPSVCSNAKAQGYSARAGFLGDPFTVDYVAHEIGHQFGAAHTYNNMDQGGACTTRSATDAFEVASGSTLMSYVGICNIRNLQQYVDTATPMFHIRSLTQIVANLQDADGGGSCGTPLAGANAIPTVNAGGNFTIPRLTPFSLTAAGNDADAGDLPNLLYSWEEYDLAPSGSGQLGTPALTYDVDTDGILRPLFRAYSPVPSPSRTFPSLQYILNPAANVPAGSNNPPLLYQNGNPTGTSGSTCQAGSDCVIGENLPSVARTMNFRVAVRDIRGGIVDAGMTVTTVNTPGPFQITSQNTVGGPAWTVGSTQTITWDVVTTDAAPISAANVRITLSTDGGRTFPITLLASTPNNGTANVTVPDNATTTARIKVEAVGNIFFDINNVDFSIVGAAPGVRVGNGGGAERSASGGVSEGDASVPFTITLSSPSAQQVTVRVSTTGITATEGTDFVSSDDFDVIFLPNTVSRTIFIPMIEDTSDEPDETFALDIVSVTNATIVDGQGIGTIIDNDPTSPTTRIIRAVNAGSRRGQFVTVPIQIDSQGNEGSVNFSANFVTGWLKDPEVTIGSGVPAGTSMQVDATQLASGRIGIRIVSPTPFAAGTREAAKIRFSIPPNAPVGLTPIIFGNSPVPQLVTTTLGVPLTTTFQTGSVQVTPRSAVATLGGRVTNLLGQSVGMVTVQAVDQSGNIRTTLTNPFGYYRFDSVPTDGSYLITPIAKRYTFTPRAVMLIDSIFDADFVGN